MRRIFAIGLVVVFLFLVALVVDLALQSYVIVNFVVKVVGPAAANAMIGSYNFVIGTIGVGGLMGIIGIFGFIVGIVAYSLWHKADWKLRRWGAKRTASDLGVPLVSQTPATPLDATTRPKTAIEEAVEKVAEEPTEKEKAAA